MNNPQNNPNYAFRFGLRPVRKLTQAIEALCDPQFNITGRGRIDVCSTATVGYFSITTRKVVNVTGLLVLAEADLENFQCTTPITGNMFVDLNHIFTNLSAHDFDTLTVFQIQGSNHITFKFGEDPAQQFTAQLFENNDQNPGGKIEVVHSIRDFCRTDLPSHDMHLLVNQLFQNGMFQPVSIVISKNESSIMVGNRMPMVYNLHNMYPNFIGGIMYPWQLHEAVFCWTYPSVLLKAARLSRYYSVFFATQPAMHVIFRFNLPHGLLYFLKEAAEVMTIDRRDYDT